MGGGGWIDLNLAEKKLGTIKIQILDERGKEKEGKRERRWRGRRWWRIMRIKRRKVEVG